MKPGAGAAGMVFGAVVLVTAGLGWVLYEAGRDPKPADAGTPAPAPDRPPPSRIHDGPEPGVDMSIPPNLRPVRIPSGAGPRFDFPDHPDLKRRNWKEVAAAFEDMHAQTRDMADNGLPSPQDEARFKTMHERLERFMKAAIQRPPGPEVGQPTTQVDHPAYAINAIAAILERAKQPLTDAQAKRLEDLARRYGPQIDEADADLATADTEQWQMERVVRLASVSTSFYVDAYAVLTPAQADTVQPVEFRGRIRLDPMSSATAWGRLGMPLPFKEEEKVVDVVTHGLGNQFRLLDRAPELRAIVTEWVRTGGFDAADEYDRRGFMRASHVVTAVPRMIELLRRIAEGMKLGPEVEAAMRQVPQAYVPLRL